MRIGIDLRLHAYAPGGIAHYARRVAEHLIPRVPAGTLSLVRHRREREPVLSEGVGDIRAWTPPHHRLERWSLGTELALKKFDLFHSPDFIPPAWGSRRFVITVHDLNFLYYPQYLTPEARRYYNEQIAWAVAHADAILADSHATRKDLIELLQVPAEKINVVHLAADNTFQPLPADELAAGLKHYGLEAGYLLFVGTWEPRKNLPGLLEALSCLHALGERRTLVIAGRPGWLYDEIFTRVQELKLDRWVRFIERAPAEGLVALYNGALLLTMPSFYEGFGLPALEAMQCGTPAVVADRASLPEVVGDAGLLVDPDDPKGMAEAFRRLAQDQRLRDRLRATGLDRAATFTWDATAEQTLRVYRRALE